MNASFNCPRTCHLRELCRFMPVISKIGGTQVFSHTVKVKVDYTDPRTLESACKSLGWKWLGLKLHHLFDGDYQGHGFTPQGWEYPAVLDVSGELQYDTFNGAWGDERQLERLKAEYAIATAEQAATDLGWQCERTEDGLTVHHPDAGILTISK